MRAPFIGALAPRILDWQRTPLLLLVFLFAVATSGAATTFYVRPDGGNTEQCTGTSNAPYPGSGTAQACAWDHPFRALPPDGTPRISGGDTLLIGQGNYMVGYGAPGGGEADGCDALGAYDCTMADLPSGPDASHRTRILGEGWDQGCGNPPELWGTERVEQVLGLSGSSHVEVSCLEITDHSSCVEFHGGSLACQRDTPPFGPWAVRGIYAEDSSDVVLSDLDIHGLASTGIHAGRLTDWTVEDVEIRANGWVGWDGDIEGDDSNSGTLSFRRWSVQWNGCGESWPDGAPIGCWAQTAGGYGDGVGTGATTGHWIIEESEFLNNTSDGLDLLYARPGSSIEIRRTVAWGNAGNQIKTAGPALVENSIIAGNCAFFEDAAFTLHVDVCRAAGNAMSITLFPGDDATIVSSTITGEGDCLVLADCADDEICDGTERVTLTNMIFVGHPEYLDSTDLTCLAWAENLASDPFSISYSIVDGVKDDACPPGTNLCGVDPEVLNDDADAFDAHLASTSPAIDAGASAGTPAIDYDGKPRDATPDIGAYEYGASSPSKHRRRPVRRPD